MSVRTEIFVVDPVPSPCHGCGPGPTFAQQARKVWYKVLVKTQSAKGAGMFRVTVTKSFSAAHALKIGGKCEDLHGHNFRVDVAVEGRELSPEGLLIDFRDLKRWTVEVLDELDHKFLNDLPPFAEECATSERVARYLFERIAARMEGHRARIAEVTVWESDNARASYTGEGR